MTINPMILTAVSGGLAAGMIDVHSFIEARKEHGRRVKFDWQLWAFRVAAGTFAGLGIGGTATGV